MELSSSIFMGAANYVPCPALKVSARRIVLVARRAFLSAIPPKLSWRRE
jgi:hypothetical protein